MRKNMEQLERIQPFEISVTYAEVDRSSPENSFDSHVHEECEVYINLSGDVSFAVEDRIYPVKPGDVIITRPYEYHHCIYNSDKLHKHFWILFSSAGNEFFLDTFFNRNAGEGNLLSLSDDDRSELISLCHRMASGEKSIAAKYRNFFSLICLLQGASAEGNVEHSFPRDIAYAINYIGKHFAEQISVADIAEGAGISLNTLERHFTATFGLTPSAYIKKKRLAHAAMLLSEGSSVSEASDASGFSDYSNFITHFKKHYGVTPFKYKKSLADKN